MTSKYRVTVGMLEVAFERGECFGEEERVTKSMDMGKHWTCYRSGIGLVWLEREFHGRK